MPLALNQPHPDPLEGLWQGYDGEWLHVARQLATLAESIPESLYPYRPNPEARSTAEVLNHITLATFYLLHLAGHPLPEGLNPATMDHDIATKQDITTWLHRSLETVAQTYAATPPADLARTLTVLNRPAHVAGLYLRILVHANEHMGQLVAYARANSITPPFTVAAPTA